jgi:hypothetical protein
MKSFKAFVFLYFSGLGGFGILGVLYLLEIGYSFTEITFDLVTMLFVTGSDGLVLVVAEKENQTF